MSKENKDAYIVKFVEHNGQKTDLALQAYKVIFAYYSTLFCFMSRVILSFLPKSCFCVQAIVELQSEKYVQTLDEKTALELDHNDKSLFVFSDFTSNAFEHCRKVGLGFLDHFCCCLQPSHLQNTIVIVAIERLIGLTLGCVKL